MEKQYTNKLTPEVLAEFAQSPFSAEDLAAMDCNPPEKPVCL